MKPDLDAIRARCDAATPGPWAYDEGAGYIEMHEAGYAEFKPDWERSVHKQPPLVARMTDTWGDTAEDGRFIAHARTDIPALLAHIEELESRVTYTVGETEWANRIAVAEQRLADEYIRRRAACRVIDELEEQAVTYRERLERVTHERDQERTAFEQENLALRRELARLMDDH